MEYTKKLVRLKTDERVIKLRQNANWVRDPSCEDDTLNYLLYTVKTLKNKNPSQDFSLRRV